MKKTILVLSVAALFIRAQAPAETFFRHAGGYFQPLGGGSWLETNSGGPFHFERVGEDSNWIYLRDSSRDTNARLPIRGGWSAWQAGTLNANGRWNALYNVTPLDLRFSHEHGFFRYAGDGQWIEISGGTTFHFAQIGADSLWFFLRDNSRNVNLRLPVAGGMSAWQTGPFALSGTWISLYRVSAP
jgi:hypothetical protein